MLKVAILFFLSLPTELVYNSALDYKDSMNPMGCGS
jgi:hypothetical protein